MDLYTLLADIIQEQQENTTRHTIIFHSTKKITGKWDKQRLDQVFTNLISNAIKYSRGGKITVTAKKKKQGFLVSITDTGRGIPQNQKQLIFNPFKRLEQNKKVVGSGLGLYICKLIVGSHHGKIWVESTEGKGSTFFVELP